MISSHTGDLEIRRTSINSLQSRLKHLPQKRNENILILENTRFYIVLLQILWPQYDYKSLQHCKAQEFAHFRDSLRLIIKVRHNEQPFIR